MYSFIELGYMHNSNTKGIWGFIPCYYIGSLSQSYLREEKYNVPTKTHSSAFCG